MTKNNSRAKGKKGAGADESRAAKPKRLSKAGEWLKAHPNGIGLIIHDMRAAMK